jgi:orotate phosphoribosyltransferase-like protein
VTDYTERAELHRPKDAETLRREVRRLNAQGLKARDIADSLRMSIEDVIAILVHGE